MIKTRKKKTMNPVVGLEISTKRIAFCSLTNEPEPQVLRWGFVDIEGPLYKRMEQLVEFMYTNPWLVTDVGHIVFKGCGKGGKGGNEMEESKRQMMAPAILGYIQTTQLFIGAIQSAVLLQALQNGQQPPRFLFNNTIIGKWNVAEQVVGLLTKWRNEESLADFNQVGENSDMAVAFLRAYQMIKRGATNNKNKQQPPDDVCGT